jgi:hypothetical protein
MRKRVIERCVAPDCTRPGKFARGLCATHWKEFRRDCIANGSWQRSTPDPKPAIPRFEYAGNEQALIDRLEKTSETNPGMEKV